MDNLDLQIKDIINLDMEITFLIGAGCSMDPPSCLPNAKEMMKNIINFACDKAYMDKILKLTNEIRFEYIVGIFQNYFDNDLKIIEYYNQSKSPNMQHFFIADMIRKGKQVITTNYDSLIEYALLGLGIEKDDIFPIITKNDFDEFKKPYRLYHEGKYPIIKIHGSVQNFRTGEHTKESLRSTIQSLGEDKIGIDIFKIEDYKYPIIQNILQGKTLIVMGYSGTDDFDIIPMLFTVKKYNKIIWICHNNDIEYSQAEIYEIYENSYNKTDHSIIKLLNDFKRLNVAKKVYFARVNTSKLIEQLIQINPHINDKVFQADPLEWMKREIKPPGKLKKLYFPHKVLLDQFENRTSLKIAKKMLKLAVLGSKDFWRWVALRDIGLIYHRKEQFKKAIKYHEMSLDIAIKMNDKKSIAGTYANLGDVYAEIEDLKNTNKYYKRAHEIYEPLGDINALIHLYHNVGKLFEERKKYPVARKYYKKCIKLVKNSNDMWKKAMVYGSYANILYLSGNPNKPIYYYRQALDIANKLNILMYVAIYLGGMGMVHLKKKEYDKALDHFQAAIRIHKVKGNKKLLALIYNNIAGVYWENKDYETAHHYWKKSYKLFKRLGLKNISSAKRIKDNIKSCKKKLHRALFILRN